MAKKNAKATEMKYILKVHGTDSNPELEVEHEYEDRDFAVYMFSYFLNAGSKDVQLIAANK